MYELGYASLERSLDKYAFPTVATDSELIVRAFALERLRGNYGVTATTPPSVLYSLHHLFQLLMSVVSARIEGNRTTVYDAVRAISKPRASEGEREIKNILDAMASIDASESDAPLTHVTVRELHRISVDGLTREGDPTPGQYRRVDVSISRSTHQPPSHPYVHAEMSEWLAFANRNVEISQQMLHVAIAHHRFLWIHPFRNGNGRVSRLLSYAMLRRHGFVSPVGLRTVNPTAVFGNDREGYYNALSAADALDNDGTVEWCTFFVRGIHEDLERLSQLQSFDFVQSKLLGPAIDLVVRSGQASVSEGEALRIAMRQTVVRAGDLAGVFPGSPSQRSHSIRSMLDRGLLVPERPNTRSYKMNILGDVLGPLVVRQLDEIGFLPAILRDDVP